MKIATTSGTHIVRGYTCPDYPGLSITQTHMERTEKPIYAITLSKSGLAVSLVFHSLDKAKEGVKFLCETGLDWVTDGKNLFAEHKARYEALVAMQGGRIVWRKKAEEEEDETDE